ncbi:helix-turn-helix domain-containing protein [Streptomyces fuscigenes]|uniref:helix-turn-helix domain-containing protein n=1 Tax=Streptomyces fuscigenes TaxID=1528880 RepID=UPI001F2AC893|nr:helix-turn-helix domain-containing protein [Streptomyces fuscigenes]MCF3961114.1 helix-turn-helix domain-containing protein [Streptomyces fuscigenes]
MGAADSGSSAGPPRSVVSTAFTLLGCLRRLGTARVSELERASGLPRTTVTRLLGQLRLAGAAEHTADGWRLGPVIMELGTQVPGEPRLREVAQRPLMDLARATGGLVALSVDIGGRRLVLDVLPGSRPVAFEPRPGPMDDEHLAAIGLPAARLATARAHAQARAGDLSPVIDIGDVDPRVSCVAAPLRLSRSDTGAVSLMLPREEGIADHVVRATRRTAGRIATELSRPAPTDTAAPGPPRRRSPRPGGGLPPA